VKPQDECRSVNCGELLIADCKLQIDCRLQIGLWRDGSRPQHNRLNRQIRRAQGARFFAATAAALALRDHLRSPDTEQL
jgi:hypothetical protein